ncbi:hypothetical protein ACTWP5_23715 [Streptomyces sp. 4N509B]|uniref:hypothetical protein n=1 Tax=Streptomyces sp. 4N509B TaxID=3457413 RepID=UPI003FCF7B91
MGKGITNTLRDLVGDVADDMKEAFDELLDYDWHDRGRRDRQDRDGRGERDRWDRDGWDRDRWDRDRWDRDRWDRDGRWDRSDRDGPPRRHHHHHPGDGHHGRDHGWDDGPWDELAGRMNALIHLLQRVAPVPGPATAPAPARERETSER